MRTIKPAASGTTAADTAKHKAALADGKLPLYFPADIVRLLEGLCEASGVFSADDYAEEFLATEIAATLKSRRGRECGVVEFIAGSYELEPGDKPAMQAVVDRWNAKNITPFHAPPRFAI